MKQIGEFRMETRPYGGGFANFVGIKCGWCDHEAWHPCKNGGWAIRIFRAHGWKIGNKPAQHRCPPCFAKAKHGRRKADNPAIPPEIGKEIKARMAYAALPATEDPMPPEEPRTPPAAVSAPARPIVIVRRGARLLPGIGVSQRRVNAGRAAKLATGGEDGVAYATVRLGDGWTWKRFADLTPLEQAAYKPAPTYSRHAKEEATMTAKVTPIRKDPMPTQEPLPSTEIHAAPPPKLDRASRTMIHDELTNCYDTADQRYRQADSDKVVAERLNVPRAWVTEVREQMFGDFDRNQAAAQQIIKLDKAIEMAKSATTRLLTMAGEAETLERELVAARKLLED